MQTAQQTGHCMTCLFYYLYQLSKLLYVLRDYLLNEKSIALFSLFHMSKNLMCRTYELAKLAPVEGGLKGRSKKIWPSSSSSSLQSTHME